MRKAPSSKLGQGGTKPLYKFTKRLCEEQYKLNQEVYKKLEKVMEIQSPDERNAVLSEDMSLLSPCNRLLILSDRHRWEMAKCHASNRIPEDSEDKKRSEKRQNS